MADIESIVSTTPPDTEAPYDVARIKRIGRRGAVWVTLTSAIAMLLAYYRNWILGRFGSDGDIIGQFALILLFIQIVTTFVLFGGTTVTTNYLPKIRANRDKSAFIFSYTILSLFLSLCFVALLHLFPGLMILLLKQPVDSTTLNIFSITAPMVVLAQMVTYALVGLTEFRLSSLLNQVQLAAVCCISSIAFFLFREFFLANALSILTITVCGASTFVILVGGYYVSKRLSSFCYRLFLPVGFWSFSSFVHLNTIITFAYLSIDQLFILSALGIKELGAYFVLMQCAQLIVFVPERIGQVMLASFSHLVGTCNYTDLLHAYVRLRRLILIVSTPLALFIILFSRPIAGIFGDWYAERHLYLLLLAVGFQLAVLGSVNAMLVMAKEYTRLFLINSVIQISVQLGLTLLLIDRFGVYSVIVGKIAGLISAQVGLFSIIRWKMDKVRLPPPSEYWISVPICLGAAALSWFLSPLTLFMSIVSFVVLGSVFLCLSRFRIQEFLVLFSPTANTLDVSK